MVSALIEELERHEISYRLEVLAHADHGFTQRSMPDYNEDATEAAWRETLDLLRRRLLTRPV